MKKWKDHFATLNIDGKPKVFGNVNSKLKTNNRNSCVQKNNNNNQKPLIQRNGIENDESGKFESQAMSVKAIDEDLME